MRWRIVVRRGGYRPGVSRPRSLPALGALSASTVLGLLAYGMVLRPWHLRWGTAEGEADRSMAGDELLPAATSVSTRATTIDRPPEAVWPWLVQMGRRRGGLYSYERLENLFGLDFHNADRIHPEWQDLQVGDEIELSRERFSLVVRELDAPRALVFEFVDGGWVWAFELVPMPSGGTRLLVRNRWSSHAGGPIWRLAFWGLEPAAFVMEQRMLRGIRDRAEGDERPAPTTGSVDAEPQEVMT